MILQVYQVHQFSIIWSLFTGKRGNQLAGNFVDEFAGVEGIGDLIEFDDCLGVALSALHEHLTCLILILRSIGFDIIEQNEIDHENLAASGEDNILSITAEFFFGPHFEASPVGWLDLIVASPSSFRIDDEVYSVDQEVYLITARADLLQFLIEVRLVSGTECVDVSVDHLFQVSEILLAFVK